MASKFSGVELMGMGNPLLDISAEVPQEVLDKYGVKLNDAILAEEKHMPLYAELVEKYNPLYIAGGATQNSIRVAQWMLKEDKGKTAYMGCIGKDQFGAQLTKCAEDDGVAVHYMVDDSADTGTCAVLVNGGERSLVTKLEAANNFKPTHLDTPEAKEIVEKAKVCYIAGFFLTVSVPSLEIVAKQFEDKIFCLNLSAPFIVQFFGDQVATALPYADYLFCNESEAEEYGKKHFECTDLKEVALKVASSPKSSAGERCVVFTQGSNSTLVAKGGVVTEYPVDPLPAEKLVDTNGAGDSFVGGFLAELVKGKDVAACVAAGHYAARVVIQQSGCTLPSTCDYQA